MAIPRWRNKEYRRRRGTPDIPARPAAGSEIDIGLIGPDVSFVPRDNRIIPQTGSGGKFAEEIVISKVVRCNDPFDAQETSTCTGLNGLDHLRCYALDVSGNAVIVEPYLPVFPNWPHTISEFSPVAWNPLDPNQPVFQVFSGSDRGGWIMSFGQGEKWVAPPTNLCGGIPTGACCILSVCSVLDQVTCELDGTYQGDGTTCTPDPCITPPDPTGACCSPVGACTELTQAICEQSLGSTYQGDGTNCSPNPCGALPGPGTCCLANGKCRAGVDISTCQNTGDLFFEGDFPCVGGPAGACCFPGGACTKLDQTCCALRGGTFVGGQCQQANCP